MISQWQFTYLPPRSLFVNNYFRIRGNGLLREVVNSRAGAMKIQAKPNTPSGLESKEVLKKGREGEDT